MMKREVGRCLVVPAHRYGPAEKTKGGSMTKENEPHSNDWGELIWGRKV